MQLLKQTAVFIAAFGGSRIPFVHSVLYEYVTPAFFVFSVFDLFNTKTFVHIQIFNSLYCKICILGYVIFEAKFFIRAVPNLFMAGRTANIREKQNFQNYLNDWWFPIRPPCFGDNTTYL